MKKYHYEIVNRSIQSSGGTTNDLNKLGEQGYRIINVQTSQAGVSFLMERETEE